MAYAAYWTSKTRRLRKQVNWANSHAQQLMLCMVAASIMQAGLVLTLPPAPTTWVVAILPTVALSSIAIYEAYKGLTT